ncbi:MAG: Glucose 1-dehydrogenase [uncultured Solirubrobacteraceae bacterium]|uniref:Glucose 1-dehydrogenase n=1 Tax=uncultured Solirubrobacteraceae bacterium TaxID=1162706 RepID=A0A6J4RNE7_9ACTN|nr:MAG: Glucose 1-dehydrogenase [uncultured Solirubrobacteraceae bacterium]
MRAITVVPGRKGSIAVTDVEEPDPSYGSVLVDGVALGICGTDTEIADGVYGEAPGGSDRLVLGHESLGRVREAPEGSGLAAGDLVIGIVRRPDPLPCSCCGRGEWDMCRNGEYTERGIKGLHGYGAQRWRIEPEFAVAVDSTLGLAAVLMEPTSIVAKAWSHIDVIASRACTEGRTVLVTGAGPIGLLAAMMGVQRGLEVHVLDHHESGPKPRLVESLGATYHWEGMSKVPEADLLIEATGVPRLVLEAMEHGRQDGIVCLTGVSPVGNQLGVDIGRLGRRIVLGNQVVFGTVNANRDHYGQAAEALAAADRGWLDGIITRRVPLEQAPEALHREPDDVKVVVDLSSSG